MTTRAPVPAALEAPQRAQDGPESAIGHQPDPLARAPETPTKAARQPRPPKKQTHLPREEARFYIEGSDRIVFVDYLLDCLDGAPTVQEIRRFSSRYPDRWAQMLQMLSKASGYRDQVEVRNDLRDLHAMSDAEIEVRARRMLETLANVPQLPEKSENPA